MKDLTITELNTLIRDHSDQLNRCYAHTTEDADWILERAERIKKIGRALRKRLPARADLGPPMIATGEAVVPASEAKA